MASKPETKKPISEISVETMPDGRTRVVGQKASITEMPDGRGLIHFASKTSVHNVVRTSSDSAGYATVAGIQSIPDRSVNLVLNRNDEGSRVAYDNCVVVKNSVDRRTAAINTGFLVEGEDPELDKEAVDRFELEIERLEVYQYLNAALGNRDLYGAGAIGKRTSTVRESILGRKKKKLLNLMPLDTQEANFRVILDVETNQLGGEAGKGFDSERPEESVIAVQRATIVNYTSLTGAAISAGFKYIPMTADDVMILGNNDLGIFRATSRVRRTLRYVEELMSLENTVRLMAKRPTQLIYTMGNEKQNFQNMEVPQSYMATAANADEARRNYKLALMEDFVVEAGKMAEGDTLSQVIEYGMDVQAVIPTESMDYLKYMNYLVDQIKLGIMGSETMANRKVTSGLMQEELDHTLVQSAEEEQRIVLNWLNLNLFWPLMESLGIDKNRITVKFKEVKKKDEKQKWEIEEAKARTAQIYTASQFAVPEDVAQEIGIDPEEGGVKSPLFEKILESKISGLNPRTTLEEDFMRNTLANFRAGGSTTPIENFLDLKDPEEEDKKDKEHLEALEKISNKLDDQAEIQQNANDSISNEILDVKKNLKNNKKDTDELIHNLSKNMGEEVIKLERKQEAFKGNLDSVDKRTLEASTDKKRLDEKLENLDALKEKGETVIGGLRQISNKLAERLYGRKGR